MPLFTPPAAAGFGTVNIQVFTATGANTYTPTAGMKYCIAFITGGGGGGGGAAQTSSSAGGGGAGGTAIEFYSAATIGASQTVTIGDGGAGSATTTGTTGTDSTFGALMTGSGGVGAIAGTATTGANGGAGGAASGGIMNIPGGYGGPSVSNLTVCTSSGEGGSSFWGGGVSGRVALAGPVTPINSTTYGSGGHGGATNTTADGTGGKGAPGVSLVIEFM